MTPVGIMRLLAMISGLAFALLLNWPVEGTRYGSARKWTGGQVTRRRAEKLARETKEMWRHGYDGYMTFAYPEDELKPISCTGQSRDNANPNNHARNDVNGNYALTHLDILSTMPLMLGETKFRKAVDLVLRDTNFDQDVKVQVFEVTIRILGSLLSSYQQLLEYDAKSKGEREAVPSPAEERIITKEERNASDTASGSTPSYFAYFMPFLSAVSPNEVSTSLWSRSIQSARQALRQPTLFHPPASRQKQAKALLALAVDLADRLLPAFETKLGIPYARVNLKHGVQKGETVETCTAGAGSLLLEFGLLSRLTGDPRYETAARKAFFAVWDQRSHLNLVGNAISAVDGHWMGLGMSTIGAGVDSFFEYALKSSVFFDDSELMDVWNDAYRAVMQNLRTSDGYIFRGVHVRIGTHMGNLLDSLSAFWPGLQVLAGDVEGAIKSHLVYWWLWRKHRAMPEAFNIVNKTVEWAGYPLRPEFVESTYHLYRATNDPFYLEVGERILHDFVKRTKTRCGFAVLHDVRTGKLEDRMESFALSETLKYLYLLFTHSSKSRIASKTFTTEGHVLSPPPFKSITSGRSQFSTESASIGIKGRYDYDYTATLVNMPGLGREEWWDEYGSCIAPTTTPPYDFEIVLSPDTDTGMSSTARGISRLESGSLLLSNITAMRARVTLDQAEGYSVTLVDGERVYPGQTVIIGDEAVQEYYPSFAPKQPVRAAEVAFRIYGGEKHRVSPGIALAAGTASTALFGLAIDQQGPANETVLSLGGPPLPVHASTEALGCLGSTYPASTNPFLAFTARGNCTFVEKLYVARQHGAAGLIVAGINQEDEGLIRPSGDALDETNMSVDDAALFYVSGAVGLLIQKVINTGNEMWVQFADIQALTDGNWSAEERKNAQELVQQAAETYVATQKTRQTERKAGLMIAGLPILNLQLGLDG